jgi:hypothetical protein
MRTSITREAPALQRAVRYGPGWLGGPLDGRGGERGCLETCSQNILILVPAITNDRRRRPDEGRGISGVLMVPRAVSGCGWMWMDVWWPHP